MDNQELNPEDLIQESGQQIQHPEGFNPEEFNQHFTRITGLESVDRINELRQAHEQLPTLQQKVQELEAQTQINPFPNEFAKNVVDMIAAGKKGPELVNYVSLQSRNIDDVSPDAAIKMQKKMERPDWGEREIEDWFNMKYEPVDEEAENAQALQRKRELMIDEDGHAARKSLQQMKADMSLPEKGDAGRNEQVEKLYNGWSKVANHLINDFKEIKISEKDEKIGLEYNLDYKVNLGDDKMKEIVDLVAKSHAGRGTKFTQEGKELIVRDIQKLINAYTWEDQRSAIIRDAFASAREAMVKENANLKPVDKGTPPPPAKKEEGRQPVVQKGGRTFI